MDSKRNMICRPYFYNIVFEVLALNKELKKHTFITKIINSFLATRGLTKTRNKAELK